MELKYFWLYNVILLYVRFMFISKCYWSICVIVNKNRINIEVVRLCKDLKYWRYVFIVMVFFCLVFLGRIFLFLKKKKILDNYLFLV